ncbi:MAG: hypothetical protein EKK63_10085 [Acinetobacter sp.]|uniref:hypothetical protein n=1 Tax=Acinetobacter sp. TaxID=472 RepID=UPI000F9FF8F1|nr:hypothetical protein [Acinetobacter sp.]RUP39339.1 MAG: hypothetical protein EKK63_10085 [Acinetobacter sp.]
MAKWTNADGLEVWLGTTEAEVTLGGELPSKGDYRKWEFELTLTDLATGSALVPRTRSLLIPKGTFLSKVIVQNLVAATGTNATLNVGLIRQNKSTTYDVDGILKVAPLTDFDTAGEKKEYVIGVTGVGDLVGTTLANSGYLVADYDTAAFTAGKVRIIIEGFVVRPTVTN